MDTISLAASLAARQRSARATRCAGLLIHDATRATRRAERLEAEAARLREKARDLLARAAAQDLL